MILSILPPPPQTDAGRWEVKAVGNNKQQVFSRAAARGSDCWSICHLASALLPISSLRVCKS